MLENHISANIKIVLKHESFILAHTLIDFMPDDRVFPLRLWLYRNLVGKHVFIDNATPCIQVGNW